jgi:S1-C subfamily serine protease
MALIPPFFLDCVVGIGTRGESGVSQYAATRFLLGQFLSTDVEAKQNRYALFLVTNRHVLDGKQSIVLRFNALEGAPAKEFDVELSKSDGTAHWHPHPDPEVDVAVVGVNPDFMKAEGLHFHFFASDKVALTKAEARAKGVSEGDGVFVLGFPMGDVGPDRNYVIVRQGVIARVRDYLDDRSKVILIDATVFPGNSGGPVVSRPEALSIEGTQAVSSSYLVGIVSAYVPYQDVAFSLQTKRPRVIFEENTGLAQVVPYDLIAETVALAVNSAAKPSP